MGRGDDMTTTTVVCRHRTIISGERQSLSGYICQWGRIPQSTLGSITRNSRSNAKSRKKDALFCEPSASRPQVILSTQRSAYTAISCTWQVLVIGRVS